MFLLRDAEVIKRILLSLKERPDKLVWHYEKRGIFSARLAYHMGMSYMERSLNQSATASSSKGLQVGTWKLLWRFTVPPKVWLTTWKMWHDIIPTMMNLKRQIGLGNTSSSRCSAREEDSSYVFFLCLAAHRTWEVWGRSIKGLLRGANSCEEVLINLLNAQQKFQRSDVAEFLIIL